MATNVPFGGWGPNPNAGGKIQRYWGGNVWTSGEDPTGGKGVNWQSAGASSTPDTTPAGGVDWAAAYKAAQSLVPTVDTSSLEGAAQNIQAGAQTIAESYKAQVPTVQNIYSNLAQQLTESQKTDTASIQKKGTQAAATQDVSAAASGFSTTSGYEAAVKASMQQDVQNALDKTSKQYGLQQDALIQEEAKDIETLTTEAAQALSQGNKDFATLTYQIISLKQQNETLLTNAASAIVTAQTEQEKMSIDAQYKEASLELQSKTLDLEAKKLGATLGQTRNAVQTINGKPHNVVINAYTGALVQDLGEVPQTTSTKVIQKAPSLWNLFGLFGLPKSKETTTGYQMTGVTSADYPITP